MEGGGGFRLRLSRRIELARRRLLCRLLDTQTLPVGPDVFSLSANF